MNQKPTRSQQKCQSIADQYLQYLEPLPPMKVSAFNRDYRTDERRPNISAPPEESGVNAGLLTWPQQWRILETIRKDKDFRREMLSALGLKESDL